MTTRGIIEYTTAPGSIWYCLSVSWL